MTDALQIALIVMLGIFTLAFVALSLLAFQVLFLAKKILRDLKFATSTIRLANKGVQAAGISAIDTLINFLKRR